MAADSVNIKFNLKGLQPALQGFSKLGASALRLAGITAGLSFGGVVSGVIAMTKSVADQAEELLRLSRVTGITVENLSRLQFASKQLDVSFEEITASTRFLGRNLQEAVNDPTSDVGQLLQRLGVDAKKAGGDMNEAFLQVGAALDKIPTHAGKVAAAQKLLGRNAAQLLPAFEDNAQALRELMEASDRAGYTMSTKTAVAADNLNDAVDGIGMSLRAVTIQTIAPSIPIFAKIGEVLAGLAQDASKMDEAGRIFRSALLSMMKVGVQAHSVFMATATALGALGAAAVEALQHGLSSANEILVEAGAEINKYYERFENAGEIIKKFAEDAESAADRAAQAQVKALGLGQELTASEIDRETEARMKRLRELREELWKLNDTFGQSAMQAHIWELQFGDLSKAPGKEAESLRNEIIALMKVMDFRETNKQLKEMSREYLKQLDVQYELEDIAAELDKLTEAKLITEQQALQIIGRKQTEQLTKEAAAIEEQLERRQRLIEMEVELGQISQNQGLRKSDAARDHAAKQLQEIVDKMREINAEAADPEIAKQMEAMALRAQELGSAFGGFGKILLDMTHEFTREVTDALVDMLDFTERSFTDTFKKISKRIASIIINESIGKPMEQGLRQLVAGFNFGAFLGGGAQAQPFYGGGGVAAPFADGGTVGAGTWALVGEEGPELIGPASSRRTVIPNDQLGGGQTFHFHFDAGVSRADIAAIIPRIKAETIAAISDLQRRGGRL